jgi:hypothetical protein
MIFLVVDQGDLRGDKEEVHMILGNKVRIQIRLDYLSTLMLTLMSSIIWHVLGTFSSVDNKPCLSL